MENSGFIEILPTFANTNTDNHYADQGIPALIAEEEQYEDTPRSSCSRVAEPVGSL
jgi:hypothetical protein